MRVGMIGLGKMGLPIARNLTERGHPDRHPGRRGAGHGRYLRPGDLVRTTIDGLGTLANRVTDPSGRTS